jgi:hypothetical protein
MAGNIMNNYLKETWTRLFAMLLLLFAITLWFDPTGLEPTTYRTRGKQANHYVTDAVCIVSRVGRHAYPQTCWCSELAL